MMEEWRSLSCAGYPNYAVSSKGRVFSFNRGGVMLRQHENGKGYLSVAPSHRGKQKTIPVHVLVARAFIGDRPSGLFILHNDGNQKNNHVDNLRYGTPLDNFADAVEHGTREWGIGEDNIKAVLSESDVIEIRCRCYDGECQADLAREYGVGRPAINKIALGKTWKFVGGSTKEPVKYIRLGMKKAREIRNAYRNGEGGQRALARRFNVGRTTVQRIIRNQIYKDDQWHASA